MRLNILLASFVVMILAAVSSHAQFRDVGIGGGIGFGGIIGQTDDLADRESRFLARAFLRYEIVHGVQADLGVGLGKLAGKNRVGSYEGSRDNTTAVSELVPVDVRFLFSPFMFEEWNPYLYAGVGALHYSMEEIPGNADPNVKRSGWSGYAPGGVGVQIRMDDRTMFEVSGGLNYAFTDNINTITQNSRGARDNNDMYWNFLAGLTVISESGSADPDGDGLTNRQEKELGTNKKVADTDGDGLKDGAEITTHRTDPLKADSDGDGLNDGDEINMYRTNPNNADSDGDGLNDNDEINKHKTDALKADTDADDLNDGQEVTQYRTDPSKADSDADGLKDGEEVTRYRTDPLKSDTDGGTVNDGQEVANNTDPLNAEDDVPKKKEIKVEVGKAIVLEGITFKTGSAVIEPTSEEILEQAFNTLDQNKDITVEIRGYTDNVGSRAANMRLSQRRADAVKAWLVKKGIDASRITTKGFGPDNPIGDNKTAEGRAKNRRIEFFRTR